MFKFIINEEGKLFLYLNKINQRNNLLNLRIEKINLKTKKAYQKCKKDTFYMSKRHIKLDDLVYNK